MPHPELTLRARYVFPVDDPPIAGGSVRVRLDRVTCVGPSDREPDIDFGNAAIVPGLVNAHTHLELSSLRAKDLPAGSFTAWLGRVIALRREQKPADRSRAIERGIDASVAAGTTLIGDISTGGASWKFLTHSPLRATVFCEVLGLEPTRAADMADHARRFLEWTGHSSPPASEVAANDDGAGREIVLSDGTGLAPLPALGDERPRVKLAASLSPHAPYSTDPQLYELAARWATRTHAPLCTHLAETTDELRLLESRSGPLRDFLMGIGAWSDAWNPVGPHPIEYLEGEISRQADWVIAHGNYLDDAAIERLASRAQGGSPRRAVVYCPRTHFYFAHPRHPYAKMLKAGVTVCLGTDSLASTPTLSVLDEMRFLHRRDDQLPGATVLAMATLAGARALGRDDCCGSLTPGKFADLAVVRLPDRDDPDPHRLLLDSDLPVANTMVNGRIVFQLR